MKKIVITESMDLPAVESLRKNFSVADDPMWHDDDEAGALTGIKSLSLDDLLAPSDVVRALED